MRFGGYFPLMGEEDRFLKQINCIDTGGFGNAGGLSGGISGSTAGQRGGRGETASSLGGAFGSFSGENAATGKADISRSREGDEGQSIFGRALARAQEKATSPGVVGGIIGALGGTLLGIGPATGAQIGRGLGEALFGDDAEKGDVAEAQAQAQTAAPSTAQAALGSAAANASAQGQFSDVSQLGGGIGGNEAQAAQLANLSGQQRVSGVQQLQQQASPLSVQQRFLTGEILPTVNLSAFPGALGRA